MGRRWVVRAAFAMAALFATALPGFADDGEVAAENARPLLAVPAEAGAWRTRSQPVYDPVAQALLRRTVTVWDPRPSRARDFVWIPDAAGLAGPERVTGRGRLVWREAGRPAYDPAAVEAEYRGEMRAGRPEGEGALSARGGFGYEGRWAAGRPEGRGRLTLPGGAEYAGAFRGGFAEGEGRFYDVDGEVFEGRFRAGLREGRGRTILPGGGAYLSEWSAGEEVANSRKVRLAQLGPARAANDEVRLGVTVERVDDDSLLQYSASNAESGLVIQPSRRRLMSAWKGADDIQLTTREENPSERGSYGIFAFGAGDVPPLTLVFEVQNRAASAVQVKGAYLEVEASATDLQPAIQLTGLASGECSSRPRPDYSPRFSLENFGWGPAERARLRFAFTAPRANAAPGGAAVVRDIGTIATEAKVDLEPELRAAGVKVDLLKRRAESGGLACKAKGNPTACLSEIASSGLFGSLARSITLEDRDVYLNATGALDYAWKDIKGVESARSSPFSAKLLLGRTPVEAECGEGAEKEPVGKKPLELRLDQVNYRLPVAFSRSIPAGRTARYTVAVKAPKASGHRFKVVLQTADGRQVASRPIALTYFVPSRLITGYGSQ